MLYTTNLLTSGFDILGTASNLPATPSVNTYNNTTLTNGPKLFYRISVRQE